MAGSQETRLRNLIAGAQLEATIDDELDQWKKARDRLHEVGAALIAVSTPVSENLGKETVASALAAFKTVGEKVNERADDIQAIHQALRRAVQMTRQAQTAVAQMDGDHRDKPEFGNGEPPTDEDDEMHDLKVYVGQMKLYNSWAEAREQKSQEHADKVETAWQDAIAVMEKIPDDDTSSGDGGDGGGGGGGTSPIMPTAPTSPTTTTGNPVVTWTHGTLVPDDVTPAVTPIQQPPTHTPTLITCGPFGEEPDFSDVEPNPTDGGFQPTPVTPGTTGPGSGPGSGAVSDPYPGTTPGIPGTPATGDTAPTPAVASSSLSGYAVGGAVGVGALGGLAAGIRAAGGAAAAGGVRTGGTLGASGRTAGSAQGSLGARTGGAASGGAASGRGTGRGGSGGAAGGRGAGGAGAGGGRGGKDRDKKKRSPATVELFDEDKDWIDDEGASTGVID